MHSSVAEQGQNECLCAFVRVLAVFVRACIDFDFASVHMCLQKYKNNFMPVAVSPLEWQERLHIAVSMFKTYLWMFCNNVIVTSYFTICVTFMMSDEYATNLALQP